jgi:hypothetical protein
VHRQELNVIRLTSIVSTASLRSRLATAVLAAGLAFTIVPASVAEAQIARGGMAALFVPDFLPRDLPVFVDSLGLEEWQRPIMETLLDDYQTTFNTAADGVRASMGQFKDVAANTNPDKIIEMITKPLLSWGDEKKRLREDFLESVRSQLSDVQSEQWPRLERALRREKALPNGELSAESLNLVMIARETDAPPAVADAALAAVEDYELKLDAALAAREAELESTIASKLNTMGANDMSRLLAIEERIMQRRVEVRNVQEQAIAAIRDALGSEYGATFEKRALRRAYPQVYGPDPVTPLFDAASALPNLTEAQKTQLLALRTRFDAEHGTIQGRYAEAIRTSEPLEPRRRSEALARKAAGGTVKPVESPEVDAIKTERNEFYARMRASIAEILTDDQKELVPGFGKPGADLPAGQKYGDAVHLGTGGGSDDAVTPVKPGAGGAPSLGEETLDPSKKPADGGKNNTTPDVPKPAKNPKSQD